MRKWLSRRRVLVGRCVAILGVFGAVWFSVIPAMIVPTSGAAR